MCWRCPVTSATRGHRADLVAAALELGGLDLLVNNASTLGASPLPPLVAYPLAEWRRVYEVNVRGTARPRPGRAARALAGHRRRRSSTSPRTPSVEAYEGWGGYGSSKAALDHLSAVLAVEEPSTSVWAVDPGDMRTQMHQDAFPGEDISDRPLPEEVVPAIARAHRGAPAERSLPAVRVADGQARGALR